MGQKQSARENWTIENRASSTGQNATQRLHPFGAIKKIPAKYFGGQTIENDPSMRQMQRDLLAFDDTLKRGCSPCRRNKRSKQQNYAEEYSYYQDEQYYDHNQQSVTEDDENYLPSTLIDDNLHVKKKKSSWQCRYCATENKLTTIECRQCGEIETRF